jgi:transcriptional regulator with XRE-family HTH domain
MASLATIVRMFDFNLASAAEISHHLGQRLRSRRLAQLMTQAELAARAGVSTGTVRTLEATGAVSADSLVRVALTLGLANSLQGLFEAPPPRSIAKLEHAQVAPRQRAPRRQRA